MRTDTITADQWPGYLREYLNTDETAIYGTELNQWHTMLEMETLHAFDNQASPEGQQWPEWQLRAKRYHSEPRALMGDGRLYRSFMRGSGEVIDKIDARESSYGSSVEYAGVHQLGGVSQATESLTGRNTTESVPAGTNVRITPRPMLGVRPDMADILAESIADSLVRQLGE